MTENFPRASLESKRGAVGLEVLLQYCSQPIALDSSHLQVKCNRRLSILGGSEQPLF